ncbi:uncharacterized protein J3D65DRAFT_635730 [Phyllosticta citribraziliensis]|uniref:Secreted protein n=1 Tax=Phyllosticta citribraziliensis TaxID=989973 RepID=A0ABR1LC92_9PEZI
MVGSKLVAERKRSWLLGLGALFCLPCTSRRVFQCLRFRQLQDLQRTRLHGQPAPLSATTPSYSARARTWRLTVSQPHKRSLVAYFLTVLSGRSSTPFELHPSPTSNAPNAHAREDRRAALRARPQEGREDAHGEMQRSWPSTRFGGRSGSWVLPLLSSGGAPV